MTTYTTSQSIQPSIQCYFQQQGDNGSGTTVPQYVFVLEATNANSYTVNVPVSNGSANANGSYNEIDFVNFDGSVSYEANYSAELPTTFPPGTQRDAGAVVVNTSDLPAANDLNSALAWYVVTPGTSGDAYDDFARNPSTNNGDSTGTNSGAENARPVAIFDLSPCSASDANAARRLLAARRR